MKQLENLLLFVSILSLLSCSSEIKQQQRDLFPLPSENLKYKYYVNEQGEKVVSWSGKVQELNNSYAENLDFFSDGVARVNKSVFINKEGEVVLDIKETFGPRSICSDFSEGVAFVRSKSPINHTAINKAGEILFELEGVPYSPFNDGLALFRQDRDRGYMGVVNTKGDIVLEPRADIYPDVFPPAQGKICVYEGELFGAINLEGEQVIDYISYEPIHFDCNNCAVVKVDSQYGLYGLIDSNGKFLIDPQYRKLVNDGEWYQFESDDEKMGWCDKSGEIKIQPIADSTMYPELFFGDKWALVHIEGEQVFIDKEGQVVLEPEYIVKSPFMKEVSIVYIPDERTCAFMNRNGELINDNRFPMTDIQLSGIERRLVDKAYRWKGTTLY